MTLLQINGLRKSFRSPEGESTGVLDIPEFMLAEREQLALEGRSGSGKTTLLHIIAGILRPDSGSVRIGGVELFELGEAGRDVFRAKHLGYVFQTFNLLEGHTALENVLLGMMFGDGPDPAFARELLERLGLAGRLNYRPRQLSVGQRQRVALARALANRPKLVLADEPTGSLDAARAREALELLRELCREREAALLVVSHDPEVLGGFERRLCLEELNLVASDAEGAGA